MSEAINILAMILSVVSLIVTTLGFFASLKFYRDGVELQGKANDALTKIEEKTAFIQTQVGGMFDKTLDAAIGKGALVSENFAELSEQLEQTKTKIIDEALKQIGDAGEQERKRLSQVVNSQIDLVRQKVETTRESAEELISRFPRIPVQSMSGRILKTLLPHGNGLTNSEISSKSGIATPTVDYFIRKNISYGLVEMIISDDNVVRFRVNKEKLNLDPYSD